MDKKNYEVWWYKNWKTQISPTRKSYFDRHHHKSPILIDSVDIVKIKVSNKISLVKRVLNISLAKKMLKN